MIIRAEDRKQTLTPNARGGDGTLDKRDCCAGEYAGEREDVR